MKTLQMLRMTCIKLDVEFKKIYSQAQRMAEKIAVEEKFPRIIKRQQHRGNQPATTPEDYYRQSLAIPFLDTLISEMKSRFSPLSSKAVKLLWLVPSNIAEANLSELSLDTTIHMYKEDLRSPELVSIEMECWKRKWVNSEESQRPNTLLTAIQVCDESRFPNIYQLLKIAATLPVTRCECKRSFSTMRRLNTWLRSSMGSNRLSALALMNIHYSQTIDYKRAVNLFLNLHPRRIDAANLIYQ